MEIIYPNKESVVSPNADGDCMVGCRTYICPDDCPAACRSLCLTQNCPLCVVDIIICGVKVCIKLI